MRDRLTVAAGLAAISPTTGWTDRWPVHYRRLRTGFQWAGWYRRLSRFGAGWRRCENVSEIFSLKKNWNFSCVFSILKDLNDVSKIFFNFYRLLGKTILHSKFQVILAMNQKVRVNSRFWHQSCINVLRSVDEICRWDCGWDPVRLVPSGGCIFLRWIFDVYLFCSQ